MLAFEPKAGHFSAFDAERDEEWSRNVDAPGSRNIRVLRGQRPVGDEAADERCGCDDTRRWQRPIASDLFARSRTIFGSRKDGRRATRSGSGWPPRRGSRRRSRSAGTSEASRRPNRPSRRRPAQRSARPTRPLKSWRDLSKPRWPKRRRRRRTRGRRGPPRRKPRSRRLQRRQSPPSGSPERNSGARRWLRPRLKGESTLARFANDAIIAFDNIVDAKRVLAVLGKRLADL